MEFLPEMHLDERAANGIARGLLAVARADGIHEREAELIQSFWIDAGGTEQGLIDLERAPAVSPAWLAAELHSDAERRVFMKTAVLLAWADGRVTDPERAALTGFGDALGFDAAKLAALEASVKEFLLSHVSHLHNTDATTAVARKLGI
jgi:tellurite resistance protein